MSGNADAAVLDVGVETSDGGAVLGASASSSPSTQEVREPSVGSASSAGTSGSNRTCNCVELTVCRGLFCPGRRFYENGVALDPVEDELERARIEEAAPELLVRMLSNQNPWLQGLPDALDLLRAADRLESWVAAQKTALTAQVFHQVDGHEASRTGETHPRLSFTIAAQEIAPLLRVPGRTAHRVLGESLRLSEDLPGTWEALEAGQINPTQAQVIVQESGSVPPETINAFERSVLSTAQDLTRPQLTRHCRELRETLHPETITTRKERATTDRDITITPDQDGMAWLNAYLPAEQAHGIINRVNTAARTLQGPQEPRTLAQLRADVFTDLLTHTCTANPTKGTGYRGIGATVFITVPVMTLLGHQRKHWQALTKSQAADRPCTEPATVTGGVADRSTAQSTHADEPPNLDGCQNGLLDGYGPIDPETARKLAAHAPSFTRILVHPETGAVLSVGRDTYRPPKHLQDWVRINNPTCIHPGCNRSSWTCEIDHTTPWAHGGTTELNNLKPRCKQHHMLKTEGIWATNHNPGNSDGGGGGGGGGGGEDGRPTSSGRGSGEGSEAAAVISHTSTLSGRTYPSKPEPPPPF